MSGRSQFVPLATKFGMLVGAIFVVTVLLAAMPGHHAPGTQTQESPQQSAGAQAQQTQQGVDPDMVGMDMNDAKANEAGAVHDMTGMQHQHNAHMHMTSPRPETREDAARAKEIVDQL